MSVDLVSEPSDTGNKKEAQKRLIVGIEIRCEKCKALLYKALRKSKQGIEIKCRKCGYVNRK